MQNPIATNALIVLASTSNIRYQLLTHSGVKFTQISPDYDEDAQKHKISHLSPIEQAQKLADGKALSISNQQSNAYIIGADQVCSLGNDIFHKPLTQEKTCAQLRLMRGKTHAQNCACAIAHKGEIIWQHSESASLTMRELSDCEIENYVMIDKPLNACGGYKFESYGKHLFAEVVGSYDAIKGLPMIPLLQFMHQYSLISLK